MKPKTIIVAPHPDDEIIGCYEVLMMKPSNLIIIYSGNTDAERRKETSKLLEYAEVKAQMFQMTVPSYLIDQNCTFYFPDPIYENHPAHREFGMMGEQMARLGMDVIFYTTNMNAPYIHEVRDFSGKEKMLNKVYPSQKSLWETEKKYILFEGRCKWLF